MTGSSAAKAKIYQGRYYQRNKARIAIQRAEFRKNNKERLAARNTEYYKKNREHLLNSQKKRDLAIRARFYDMYGLKKQGHEHGVCPCCGEDLMAFGTISHIDGNGVEHRRTMRNNKMLLDALVMKDTSRFAAECFNCNLAAVRNGGICPHKNSVKAQEFSKIEERGK